MKVTKNDISATLEIGKEDLVKLLAKGAMKITGDRNFTINTNLPDKIFVNLAFARKLTKREISERQEMMENAKGIPLRDFMIDFHDHTVGNKNSVTRIGLAVRASGWVYLSDMLSVPATELTKFRGISQSMVDILEGYVKSRGFRFAIQNGTELV
ncbi:MAG: hypothetical protein ABIO57_03665 [Candidatus Paceibacterota bacterium]